jgi:hypothetical protein
VAVTAGEEGTLGGHAATQVNRLLEKRAGRSRGGGGSGGGYANNNNNSSSNDVIPSINNKAPHQVAPVMRGYGTAKGAATTHNNALLANAAATSDRSTITARTTRGEQGLGACGALATRTAMELDEENFASRDEADDDADAAAATVAAAAAAAAAGAVKRDDDADEPDDEEEWEEQGLHDYDAMAYDANDLVHGVSEDDDDAVQLDDDDAAGGKGGAKAAPARRMTGEERAGLRAAHQTHLLCLLARTPSSDCLPTAYPGTIHPPLPNVCPCLPAAIPPPLP